MAAPLNTCTTIEQRGVRFLWAKNMEAKDMHKEIMPIWASHCHCSLFSKKNLIIWIFYISGWLGIPVNPDNWSSTELERQPASGTA
jgi:hypothetical protein